MLSIFRAIAIAFTFFAGMVASLATPHIHVSGGGLTNSQIADLRATGESKCISPPANFNPLIASQSDIILYGLPRRPNTSTESALWLKSVKGAKRRECNPGTRELRGKRTRQPVYNSYSAICSVNCYANWSGTLELATLSYRAVRSFYNANCPSPDYDPIPGYSQWVGLGGFYEKSLWQGGWDGIARRFWYEQVGGSHDTGGEITFSLSGTDNTCNHQLYTYVDYNFELPGGTYAYYYDETTGMTRLPEDTQPERYQAMYQVRTVLSTSMNDRLVAFPTAHSNYTNLANMVRPTGLMPIFGTPAETSTTLSKDLITATSTWRTAFIPRSCLRIMGSPINGHLVTHSRA
jgi:hypothetical protein